MLFHHLPLEYDGRPVRVQIIPSSDTVKTWLNYPRENLIGVFWIHVRQKYGTLRTFFSIQITQGMNIRKLTALHKSFSRFIYFKGMMKTDLNLFVSEKEGICFVWFGMPKKKDCEAREKGRKIRLGRARRAEGLPSPSSPDPAPQSEVKIESIQQPSLPNWAKPRTS